LIEPQRPNVPNVARFNAWGIKYRGVTPSAGLAATVGGNGYYGGYWGVNYSSSLIAQQFNQAVQVGANHVKGSAARTK
jgi:hypothetical protein